MVVCEISVLGIIWMGKLRVTKIHLELHLMRFSSVQYSSVDMFGLLLASSLLSLGMPSRIP